MSIDEHLGYFPNKDKRLIERIRKMRERRYPSVYKRAVRKKTKRIRDEAK